MKPFAAAILALATSAGCKSEVGGVPCIADSICHPACASDPDCAAGVISASVAAKSALPALCGRYVVEDVGNAEDGSGTGLVRDIRTGLLWLRFAGASGSGQRGAAAFCARRGMRLPTKEEALAIADKGSCNDAWPMGWGTWTSSFSEPNEAWHVGSLGNPVRDSLLTPVRALCVRGVADQ